MLPSPSNRFRSSLTNSEKMVAKGPNRSLEIVESAAKLPIALVSTSRRIRPGVLAAAQVEQETKLLVRLVYAQTIPFLFFLIFFLYVLFFVSFFV